jgi:radical SAM family uncharacterized protein/radical SAM-linked protein
MTTRDIQPVDIASFLDRVLPSVSKPGRYIGGEVNARRGAPSAGDIRVCVAFPEVYEIGMSHQGTAIILDILNETEGVFAERAFAVWPDMEEAMGKAGVPLYSLETRTPLSAFDIIGFSLMYELTYTNVVRMLKMARIPVLSANRDERSPLLIAGGACTFNPEPVADIFDVVVVGDGEEVMAEIIGVWKENRTTRRGDLLTRLAGISGVYIPRFYEPVYRDGAFERMDSRSDAPAAIRKRTVSDLNAKDSPRRPIIPHVRAVHDRISVEIARGCRRGCRFCQAGYIDRPLRERDAGAVRRIVEDRLSATGMEDVSLLSLSSGDYTGIGFLMADLMGTLARRRVALSVPSLRVDTLTDEMIAQIRRVRKTGFTVAPEAGSERLRAVINKNITEAEIEATIDRVFAAGWRLIKLYFMIGLPTETDEDVSAIAELVGKIERRLRGRGRGGINVAVSTFIPKPHTPFQWEPMMGLAEIRRRQEAIRRSVGSSRAALKFHDSRMSTLEAAFSRGDRRLCAVIIRAAESGCRFDGWSEHFRFDLWETAFREAGAGMEDYAQKCFPVGGPLPWGHIETGVSARFLADERERAYSASATVACVPESCSRCDVCGPDTGAIRVAAKDGGVKARPSHDETPPAIEARLKYLFLYSRSGLVRFLSHLELASAIERAFARAEVPLNFTEGFHPKPRISFPGALPVGVEARWEPFAAELCREIDTEAARERINGTLPEGIRIEAIVAPSDRQDIRGLEAAEWRWRVRLPDNGYTSDDVAEHVRSFLNDGERWYEGKVDGRDKRINVRPFVVDMHAGEPGEIVMVMKRIGGSSPSPYRVIAALLGIPEREARSFYVVKEGGAEPWAG